MTTMQATPAIVAGLRRDRAGLINDFGASAVAALGVIAAYALVYEGLGWAAEVAICSAIPVTLTLVALRLHLVGRRLSGYRRKGLDTGHLFEHLGQGGFMVSSSIWLVVQFVALSVPAFVLVP
jgi:hypothetical protein